MRKLNNKGMTIIEILISFVLIMMITASMYSTISSFNQKRMIESYKEQILTYKNTLTKEIQDDFIKIGLSHANYERIVDGDTVTHRLNCDLKDGTARQLIVTQRLAYSSYHIAGSHVADDYFMISYGRPDDLIEYDLPDLGSSKNQYDKDVKDLSINNVLIEITEDNVLSVYIGFYHPELTTRYAIEVIAPINFVFSGAEFIDPTREIYLISYDLKGGHLTGGAANPNMYMLNSPTITLNNPVKEAAIFKGWTGSNGGVPEMNVSISSGSQGHKYFSAHWDDFICKIHYDPNGGIFSKNATNTSQECKYESGSSDGCSIRSATTNGFYRATREGYEVCRTNPWVKNGTPYSAKTYPTSSICPGILSGSEEVTLQVNWAAKYSITYELDGGHLTKKNPDSYNTCSSAITLNNPTKEGYAFLGWKEAGGTEINPQTVIPTGSTGNKSYIAIWSQNTIVVTIHGAVGDIIHYDGPVDGDFSTNAQGSQSIALPSGRYTFTSEIAKKTDLVTPYERQFQITESTSEILFFPAGAIYWYGNGAVPGSYLYDKMGGIDYSLEDEEGESSGTMNSVGNYKEWIYINPHTITAKVTTTENHNYSATITTKKSFKKGDYTHLKVHLSASNNTVNETENTSTSSFFVVGTNLKKESFGKGKEQLFSLDLSSVLGKSTDMKFKIQSEVNGINTSETTLYALWLTKD